MITLSVLSRTLNTAVQRARAIGFSHVNSTNYLPYPASTLETQWRWSGFTQRPAVHPQDLQPLSLRERWSRPVAPGLEASVFQPTAFAAAAQLAAAAALTNVQRMSSEPGPSLNASYYSYPNSYYTPSSVGSHPQSVNSFPGLEHQYQLHTRPLSTCAVNFGVGTDRNLLEQGYQHRQLARWNGGNENHSQVLHVPGLATSVSKWCASAATTLTQQSNDSSIKLTSEESRSSNPPAHSRATDPAISTSTLPPDSSCSGHSSDNRQTASDCMELLRRWLSDSNFGPECTLPNSAMDRKTRCTIWITRLLSQADSLLHRIRLDWNAAYQGERRRPIREGQTEGEEDESESEFLDDYLWLCRMRDPTGLRECQNRAAPAPVAAAPLPDTTQITSVELTDSERKDIMSKSLPKLTVLLIIQVS